jgi:homocysteine S-methyltransferase
MTPREQLDLAWLRVLDGGLATELERAGCDLSTPLWSGDILRRAPERVLAVHRSYLSAGADCLLTASYQVSAAAFRAAGLPPEGAAAALRQSVAIADQARRAFMEEERLAGRVPRRIWIAASLGAYGAALPGGAEFHGDYGIGRPALAAFHAERIRAVEPSPADFLAFETVPLLEEAASILDALESFPSLGACISFTCRDQGHTAHGEAIEDCASLLQSHPQVVAIGINCTAPAHILPLIRRIRAVSSQRIAVYPNSGETWVASTRSWSGDADPSDFRRLAQEWRSAGADWIGGCCRTTPAHIRAVAAAL